MHPGDPGLEDDGRALESTSSYRNESSAFHRDERDDLH